MHSENKNKKRNLAENLYEIKQNEIKTFISLISLIHLK